VRASLLREDPSMRPREDFKVPTGSPAVSHALASLETAHHRWPAIQTFDRLRTYLASSRTGRTAMCSRDKSFWEREEAALIAIPFFDVFVRVNSERREAVCSFRIAQRSDEEKVTLQIQYLDEGDTDGSPIRSIRWKPGSRAPFRLLPPNESQFGAWGSETTAADYVVFCRAYGSSTDADDSVRWEAERAGFRRWQDLIPYFRLNLARRRAVCRVVFGASPDPATILIDYGADLQQPPRIEWSRQSPMPFSLTLPDRWVPDFTAADWIASCAGFREGASTPKNKD